ncbi:MAG: universal stress protein [Candidatus Hodarchaeota archaeon]
MSFLFSEEWKEPKIQRILVPVQGFPAEVNAINLAFYLAEYSEAKISVLHCKERFSQTSEYWLNRLSGHVKSLSVLLQVPFNFEEITRFRASDAILRSSHKQECDLIIMSAAQRPDYKYIFGSTARRVARKTKVPLLVIASWLEDFAEHQEPVLRKILIPIRSKHQDFSALHLAATLKRSSAAKTAQLIALNITLLPLVTSLTATDAPEIQLERERFIEDVTIFSNQTGIKIIPRHVAARKLSNAAIEIANEEQVDLIILGTQQKPRRFGGFLGRLSRKIATESNAAVVLIFGTE